MKHTPQTPQGAISCAKALLNFEAIIYGNPRRFNRELFPTNKEDLSWLVVLLSTFTRQYELNLSPQIGVGEYNTAKELIISLQMKRATL